MPLRFIQIEEINVLLLEVPELAKQLECRGQVFVDNVLSWLKRVEEVMTKNSMPEVSHISVSRSLLLEAMRGQNVADIKVKGRPTTRKLCDSTAVAVLQKCNQILHDTIAERRNIFQEAERIAQQIITIADAKGLIEPENSGSSHQCYLEQLQVKFLTDSHIANLYIHLISLVGKTDVLVFVDRAIPSSQIVCHARR